MKSAYKNTKCKISRPTCNGASDVPDRSYSITDTQDYFGLMVRKRETSDEISPVSIYSDKTKIRIVFKVEREHKLLFLSTETMKLIVSRKKMLIKTKTERMHQN